MALALLGSGCADSDPAGAKKGYWPDEKSAEVALHASLDAWTPGQAQQSLTGQNPRVETWDSTRADGRELVAYEILGQVGANGERTYAVRLKLANPPEERLARYLVRGLNPIWVFRWEDYERISHWEHEMAESNVGDAPPRTAHHSDQATDTSQDPKTADLSTSEPKPPKNPENGAIPD
jgi:hypothetical protein